MIKYVLSWLNISLFMLRPWAFQSHDLKPMFHSLWRNYQSDLKQNKKVLLRERKRHTARRVAIASPCYSGGGVPRQNFFSPVWTCIKLNLVSKCFLFTGGGVPSTKIFFPQSEHVSSQIWCQKFFPLLRGGFPRQNIFYRSKHVSSQIWCQKFFPLLGAGAGGGVPRQKFFFPVWTCIKPNLVSKIFPFTGGWGGSLDKNFFFQSEHVSSQIWCQKFFPLLRLGTPPQIWDQDPPRLETGYPPTWTWNPPFLDLDLGHPLDLGPPPYLDLGPPQKCGQTQNITSRHPSDAGGKYTQLKLNSN